MGEGTVFSLSIHIAIGREGYSVLLTGGYPFQGQDGGTPIPGQNRRYPIQLMGGTPVWVPGQDGGIPQLEQHSVHLLRGRRYASCVHARGLSCWDRYPVHHRIRDSLVNRETDTIESITFPHTPKAGDINLSNCERLQVKETNRMENLFS